MSHPLETKLRLLRARVRRLLSIHALGWFLGVGLAALVAVGLADYVFRFRDPGMRVLGTLSFAAALGWAGYRFVYRAWRAPLGELDLARRVQRRFPALGDDLASAVEFLGQSDQDPTAGSPSLRRAVIARATADAEKLDLRNVLAARPAWRAALLAAAVGALAGMLVAADPGSSRIAAARLVRPLADIPWPQVHHLQVRSPIQRIARGQPFEVEVVDAEGVRLPAEVRIEYRWENADGTLNRESEPMRLVQGMMVARRERVTRPFSFRAEGGDDRSMPWHRVEVVDPPAIGSLDVTLTPPAYTGWPAEHTDGNIRALVGTRVEIAATATKPLASAVLLLESGEQFPARLSDDGLGLSVPGDGTSPWVIEKSGSYTFRFADREGLAGGEDVRWEIRAMADAPPTVVIEQPSAGLFVTPQAVLPLCVTAGDDLALQSIVLQFARSGDKEEKPEAIVLYAGPKRAKAGGGLASIAGRPDTRKVQHDWSLDPLRLAPGTQWTFWAVASDYRPQTTRSEPRSLTIVTADELGERIAARQAAILGELDRVLQMQRRGREQVSALEKRAGGAPRLEQRDVDQLRGTELNQRQVEQTLLSRSEGVPMHVLALLADLAMNRIEQPDVRRPMEALLAEIERLGTGPLPAVERELTAAIKAAQGFLDEPGSGPGKPAAEKPSRVDPSVADPLAAAGKHQDAVLASLERLIRDLSRWDRFRRFHREVGQVAHDQGELAGRTGELARRTLAKELKDLTPQEAADLDDAARAQAELANRLEAVQQAMEQSAGAASAAEAAAAQAVAEGLRRARELNVSGEMRAAGSHIERNQLGQARRAQERIQESLREVLDALAGRPRRESPAESTDQPGPDLEKIAKAQEQINRRTQELHRSRLEGDRSSAEARQRYNALGGEQEQLADLLAPESAGPGGSKAPAPAEQRREKEEKALPVQPADGIDRELFAPDEKKAAPPAPPAEEAAPPTPRSVAGKMRRSGQSIRSTDAGPATQALQRRILTELEELLRQSGSGRGPTGSQQAQKAAQQGPSPAGKAPKPGDAASQTKPGAKPSGSGIAPNTEEAGAQGTGPGGRSAMVRQVWGDLPQHQREQMLQLQPPEEFLPKYELLIEEYFKRLAEGAR